MSDRYVFLTRDGHTLVVLVPEAPEAGMTGPKKVVRVPLRNNLAPSVSVSVAAAGSGTLSYKYTVSNGDSAEDAIGAFTLIVPASHPTIRAKGPAAGEEPLWAGASVFGAPAIAKQAIFPEAPLGRYLGWFHQDDHVIRPGEELAGFGIESSYRPGLTTAWFSTGKPLGDDIDQSWPREVFQQLKFIEDRRWREKYVITVGPMFPPDTPREAIVASFRTDVDGMVNTGWLDRSSPFTVEVVTLLRTLGQPIRPGRGAVLRSPPSSNTENAIAAALRFTLGVALPQ
ncbi:MAG TPA: hypothetical protein VEU62_08060 [Bryobacterales bacterium]|nr:hypothetical protein [Bryobacterales bacterium]